MRVRLKVEAALAAAAKGMPFWYRAWGTSMTPRIRPGALLRVIPCHATDLQHGQVVMVLAGDRLLVHRVLERHGELWLKGDARTWDGPLRLFSVVGHVSQIHPRSFFERLSNRLHEILSKAKLALPTAHD